MSRKKKHIPRKREYWTRHRGGHFTTFPVSDPDAHKVEMYSVHRRYKALCGDRVIGSRIMRMDQQATCRGCLQKDHGRGWVDFVREMSSLVVKTQWEALSPAEQEQAREIIALLRAQAEGAEAEFARQVQRQLLLGDM